MTYEIARAREEFDRWSRRYDGDPLQRLFFQPSHRILLELLGEEHRRILDVGCGTGQFALRVLDRYARATVVGLDLSTNMLRRARERYGKAALDLVCADSERLPFADGTFDAVTCSHSFHHYPNQEQVLMEMHRVLRRGGRLLLIDGDRDRWWGRFLFDCLVVWLEGPVRHQPSRVLRRLFQETGFEKICQRRRRGPLPFLVTIGQARKRAA
jgi:ubiquinone/menaquinone biosynthesis C-methylase UbiE